MLAKYTTKGMHHKLCKNMHTDGYLNCFKCFALRKLMFPYLYEYSHRHVYSEVMLEVKLFF